jgi:3-hydroxyacyl-[acyl-carrier-protein] dehydratase
MLDINKIKNILPHRFPFLLVDRVLEVEEQKRAVAIKNVSVNEPFFQGHFPNYHVMPGVLIVEALAQVAGIAIYKQGESNDLGLFAGIDSCRFKHQVVPGDQLRLEFEVTRKRKNIIKGKGIATVNGDVVCEAEIMIAISPLAKLD